MYGGTGRLSKPGVCQRWEKSGVCRHCRPWRAGRLLTVEKTGRVPSLPTLGKTRHLSCWDKPGLRRLKTLRVKPCGRLYSVGGPLPAFVTVQCRNLADAHTTWGRHHASVVQYCTGTTLHGTLRLRASIRAHVPPVAADPRTSWLMGCTVMISNVINEAGKRYCAVCPPKS